MQFLKDIGYWIFWIFLTFAFGSHQAHPQIDRYPPTQTAWAFHVDIFG
jgi:hypothetical protein